MRGTRLDLRFDDAAVAELRELADTPAFTRRQWSRRQVNRFRSTPPSRTNEQERGEATPPEPQPVWKRQLSLITNTVRANPVAELDDWSSGREILYLIDPDASRSQRQTHGGDWLPRTHHEGRMGQDQIATYSHECGLNPERSR